jgi:hypothetical protein
MNGFRFAAFWTLNLIRINPAKAIAIAALVASAPFLNSIPDVVDEKRIDYRYEKDGRDFYVTVDIESNKESYEVEAYDKGNPPVIKNGSIVETRWNDANILLFLLCGVAIIMIAVGIFSGDDDISFDLRKVFYMTASRFVVCELEEGIYYYFLDGRLLGKSDHPMNSEYEYICRKFSVTSRTKLASFPKWKTKTAKRSENLESIGI